MSSFLRVAFRLIFALCLGHPLLPSLRAQVFASSASSFEVGFVGGEPSAQRTLTLSSADSKFATAALTVRSSATWLQAALQSGNSALHVTVSGANFSPSSWSGLETGTITIKSRNHTATITVSRWNFGASFASALSQSVLTLHHPSQPRIYLIQSRRILTFDSESLKLVDWRLTPASRIEDVRDAYVSRDGTRLVALYDEHISPHLLTLNAESLDELSDHAHHLYYGPEGRIAEGPQGVVYHSKGDLSVFAPDGSLRQRLNGPSPYEGPVARSFRSLAISPDGEELWVQFVSGGAGKMSDLALTRFTIDPEDGTLTETGVAKGLHHGLGLVGTPAVTPVLFSPEGFTLANHHAVFEPRSDSPLSPSAVLSEPILGLGLDGRLALTARGLVLVPEDKLIRALPLSGYARRFLFNPDGTRLLWSGTDAFNQAPVFLDLDLLAELHAYASVAGASPADGGVLHVSGKLDWTSVPSADSHRVYLAATATALNAGTPGAETLLGETTTDFFTLPAGTPVGTTLYWRVDTIVNDRVLRGAVRSFRIVEAVAEPAALSVATVKGAPAMSREIAVQTADSTTAWTLSSDAAWITVTPSAGIGPATVHVEFTAASLTAGTHSAALTLTSDEADSVVPISLVVDPLAITMLRDDPDAARCYALSESAGSGRTYLLAIDAATGSITHAVHAGGSATDFTLHPLENRLYVAHWLEGKLRAFSAEDLSLVQTYDADFPRANGHPGDARGDIRRIFAGRAGRLLIESGPPLDEAATINVLGLMDTANGVYLDALYASGASTPAVSDLEGGRHYREGALGLNSNYSSAARRGIDLQSDQLLQNLASTGYESVWVPTYFVTHEPSLRLYFGAHSADNIFGTVRVEPDVILAVSSDERIKVAPHLVFVDGQPRQLPRASQRIFNRAAQRVVSTDPESITISDPFALPAAQPVMLSATALNDRDISLSWTQPEVPVPANTVVQIDRRVLGAPAWTTVYSNFDGSAISLVLDYHTPETSYEFRLRYYQNGILTPWSEATTATTGIARPALPVDASNPLVLPIAIAGESLLVPTVFTGADITLSVSGIPPGMVYSAETRTLSGVCDTPGRYTILVTATNASGSEVRVIHLLVRAKMHDAPTARYTGIIDPDGSPLMGIWSLTRSGDKVTGNYRTPFFTRSFKATFDAPTVNHDPLPVLERRAVTRIGYNGVRIYVEAIWDMNRDTINLVASTDNLVENFSASTTPETGLASHWTKTTHPHPDAARYTGLLYPGEGSGPEGSGFFTLDLATDGTARIGGETSLGQKFTQTLAVSDVHSLPFFYYSGITLALGELAFTREVAPGAPAPRLLGEFVWARDTSRKSAFYRDGFEQQLLVIGAPLPATGNALPPLAPLANPANRADFALTGGGLARLSKPITQTITPTLTGFTAPKAGTPENPNRVSTKLDVKTGRATGSAAILDAAGKKVVRTQSYRAMFVKDPLGDGQDLIGGYFLLPDGTGAKQSGLVEITEPESDPAP